MADNTFEDLARRYWQAWGDALGTQHPASSTNVPGWQEAVDGWSRLVRGGNADADAAVDRFSAQARDWYGQMQQVAARFADAPASPADLVEEWKRALGALGGNPFAQVFASMQGAGAYGTDQWARAAQPLLDAWRGEARSWLGMPAFGIGREHQERLQALLQAQLDSQQRQAAHDALMLEALQQAFALFQDKLAQHQQSGQPPKSARALFDLWIDAAEDAYAQIALSPRFRESYGAMLNAQMKLRQGVLREVELQAGQFGMPTRSEMDAAHRKIADLERELRRMRDAAAANPAAGTPKQAAPGPAKQKPAAKKPAAKKSARKPAGKAASA